MDTQEAILPPFSNMSDYTTEKKPDDQKMNNEKNTCSDCCSDCCSSVMDMCLPLAILCMLLDK